MQKIAKVSWRCRRFFKHMWCFVQSGTILQLKNVKNALKPATLLKASLLHGYFSRFLNCTNGIKSRKGSYFSYFAFLKCAFVISSHKSHPFVISSHNSHPFVTVNLEFFDSFNVNISMFLWFTLGRCKNLQQRAY